MTNYLSQMTSGLFHKYFIMYGLRRFLQKNTLERKIKYPETIIKTPVSSYIKAFLTKYFLLLGFTINAPKVTAKFPDKISLKELQNNWKNSRSSFSKLIEELNQKNLSEKAIFRHALMGRINLSLTLFFFELHFNHHLKQINKRINSFT